MFGIGTKTNSLPTIDSLRFDVTGWQFHGEREPGRMRVWETPQRDGVLLNFFAKPPDIPIVADFEALHEFFAKSTKAIKATLVEFSVVSMARHRAIWMVLKVPQQPRGMTYMGSFTVPFSDFSFVIRIQSPEIGRTGMREAILVDKRLKAGERPNTSGGGPLFPNWNPDAPEFDNDFPNHPVSRVRRLFKHIAESAAADDSLAQAVPFALPCA